MSLSNRRHSKFKVITEGDDRDDKLIPMSSPFAGQLNREMCKFLLMTMIIRIPALSLLYTFQSMKGHDL